MNQLYTIELEGSNLLSFSKNNRFIFSLNLIMILSGIILPCIIVFAEGALTNEVQLPGVPVETTAFSVLISDRPDPVMLPEGEYIKTGESFFMNVNYDNLSRVSSTLAENSALDFLEKISYLKNENLTLDVEQSDITGFDNSLWRIQFLGGCVKVSVLVNALSGKVVSIEPVWQYQFPFNITSDINRHLSRNALEQKAIQFLNDNNYTLTENARYFGPTLGNHYGFFDHDVYSLSFYNVIRGAVVWWKDSYKGPLDSMGPLSLALDPETGAILHFQYEWMHVSEIPIVKMIRPALAEQIAAEYISVNRNASPQIQASILLFERIDAYPQSEFRLCWAVYTNSNFGPMTIHIDALDGSVITFGGYIAVNEDLTQTTFGVPVIWAILFSMATASTSYIIIKKKFINYED
jgi:hypothetical protein